MTAAITRAFACPARRQGLHALSLVPLSQRPSGGTRISTLPTWKLRPRGEGTRPEPRAGTGSAGIQTPGRPAAELGVLALRARPPLHSGAPSKQINMAGGRGQTGKGVLQAKANRKYARLSSLPWEAVAAPRACCCCLGWSGRGPQRMGSPAGGRRSVWYSHSNDPQVVNQLLGFQL